MGKVAGLIFAVTALAASKARAQTIVEPTDRGQFNDLFDHLKGDALNCNVMAFKPFVDFAFRFELGYVVDCDLRQFDGEAGELRTYLRARPEGGREVILGDQFSFQGFPKEAKMTADLHRVHSSLEFSGALAAGAGSYSMELLIFDSRQRLFRHTWKVKAFPRGDESKVNLSLMPGTLETLRTTPIQVNPSPTGTHVTVLMNAAPINSNSVKLRAWDRSFLLDSLSSLLRQLSYSSVRVVAFNLDQQREIYRHDDFGQAQFGGLARALRNLELGTVSYKTLERKRGWADLLLGMLQEEARATPASDAVVFLGPSARFDDKVPHEMLTSYNESTPRLFCLAYYPRVGAEFPDSIQHLTSALRGKVFRVHTPGDLAQNIAKLKHEIEVDPTSRASRAQK
jgi:hypothetical protein